MKSPSLEAAPRQRTTTRAAADWGRCFPSGAQAEGPVDTPEAKEKPKAAPEQKHKKAGKAGKGHVTGGTGLMDILTAQREQ